MRQHLHRNAYPLTLDILDAINELGDSLVPISDGAWIDWDAAVAAAGDHGIRSGVFMARGVAAAEAHGHLPVELAHRVLAGVTRLALPAVSTTPTHLAELDEQLAGAAAVRKAFAEHIGGAR